MFVWFKKYRGSSLVSLISELPENRFQTLPDCFEATAMQIYKIFKQRSNKIVKIVFNDVKKYVIL